MLYRVVATVTKVKGFNDDLGKGSFRTMVQVPTFLLDSEIQGITNVEHARDIAANMLQSLIGPNDSISLGVCSEDQNHYASFP
jgi:hypothetical protein